jgi:hypothetical protein
VHWSFLLLTVQVHTAGCIENSIGPHDGVIYSWLFKYTQHTAGCIENSIGPRDEVIYSWLYKYTQHTAGGIENSIGPRDGVITLGCTSTHNTLQDAQRTALGPMMHLSLLAVQVHTTHCRMYREQHWALWWIYLFLTVQAHTIHCRMYREQHWAPWWSYHSWLYKYT